MTETALATATYAPSEATRKHAHVDAATYDKMYAASINDPDGFWSEQAQRVDWIKPFTKVKDVNFDLGNVHIKWFEDGTLNVAANCVDRHLATRGDQTAIIWEPDDPKDAARHITYKELHGQVGKMANVLKAMGVKKGDRIVSTYTAGPFVAGVALDAFAKLGLCHIPVGSGNTERASQLP